MIYAGLDVGTTGSKISVFDDKVLKEKFYLSYKSKRDENGHEINPFDIIDAVKIIIKKACDKYPSLSMIGITSFGETCVMLDKDDNQVFPSLLYTDPRGEKEAKYLEKCISKEKLGNITGQIGRGMYSLPKIMALKKENEEKFKKVNKIFLIEDFIIYCLTGQRYIDYSLASRTMAFDVKKHVWSKEILSIADIDKNLFSNVCPSGTYIGNIKDSIMKELSLINSIGIMAISHDQIANAIGSNVFEDGSAVDGCGTCECITVAFSKVIDESILYEKGYGIIPYINEKQNVCYVLNNTSGALIDWIVDTFFSDYKNKDDYFSLLNEHIKSVPSKVMILPYFAGSSTPYMDLTAKGAFINVELANDRFDFYQACLESLTYEMKLSLDILNKAGIHIDKLYVSGGGANNDSWLQIKANILNIPIYQLEGNDAGSIGSGILVGKYLKIFSSIKEGMEKMIKIKKVFYPIEEKYADYMKVYEHYKKIYPAMKEINDD